MPTTAAALDVARYLARTWRIHRTPEFVAFLAYDFHYQASAAPQFARIFIGEAMYGDAAKGVIGGELRQWWVADGSGLRETDNDFPDFATDGDFYRAPVLCFLLDGNAVTIGEWFGPSVRSRRVGRYVIGGDGPCVTGLKLLWARCPGDSRAKPPADPDPRHES